MIQASMFMNRECFNDAQKDWRKILKIIAPYCIAIIAATRVKEGFVVSCDLLYYSGPSQSALIFIVTCQVNCPGVLFIVSILLGRFYKCWFRNIMFRWQKYIWNHNWQSPAENMSTWMWFTYYWCYKMNNWDGTTLTVLGTNLPSFIM